MTNTDRLVLPVLPASAPRPWLPRRRLITGALAATAAGVCPLRLNAQDGQDPCPGLQRAAALAEAELARAPVWARTEAPEVLDAMDAQISKLETQLPSSAAALDQLRRATVIDAAGAVANGMLFILGVGAILAVKAAIISGTIAAGGVILASLAVGGGLIIARHVYLGPSFSGPSELGCLVADDAGRILTAICDEATVASARIAQFATRAGVLLSGLTAAYSAYQWYGSAEATDSIEQDFAGLAGELFRLRTEVRELRRSAGECLSFREAALTSLLTELRAAGAGRCVGLP